MLGIEIIAVTDHNSIEGAKRLAKFGKLKVIIGEEINTLVGEVIGLFLKEKISPYMSFKATIKEIKAQNGLVMVPHPFDPFRRKRLNPHVLFKWINNIDIIEVFNSRCFFKKSNEFAKKIAAKFNKLQISGSDAHFPFEIGKSITYIEDFSTPQEFVQNLKNAKFDTQYSGVLPHILTKLLKWYLKVKQIS